ncbi:hypothetical protein FACS1894113_1100 [Alphaproteobacteria bacterium]|nr:hypothetical protein FACS1894113_1100 [Alphaproteobacteria bacterium]
MPTTLHAVMNGSKRMYNAVDMASMSEEKPRYFCIIGSMTRMPPPGTAATANLASMKCNAKIIYVENVGPSIPNEWMIAIAVIGMKKQSPTRCILTVDGIAMFALTLFLTFCSAALSEIGSAAALDIEPKAVTPAGKTFFKYWFAFFILKFENMMYCRMT